MAELGDICKRCKKEVTTVTSRKDTFCENCFIRFIRGKQRKQMQDDKFKVKFKVQPDHTKLRVLLDFENNDESYVLLDSVISMLMEQSNQGPKAVLGFELIVSVINDSLDFQFDLAKLQNFYGIEELQKLGVSFIEIDCNSFVTDNKFEQLALDIKNFQTLKIKDDIEDTNIKSYSELLHQAKDKTTREDLSIIVHEDITIKTAIDNKCSIILKSDSMTRMAVTILSDTIRGRGAEIPRHCDNKYIGTFEMMHPLSDILNSEIKTYIKILGIDKLSPSLSVENVNSNLSTKSKTVNDMISEYFQTLEIEYPETVSTVVKIGGKLSNNDENIANLHRCEICKFPIYHDPKQWLEQITVLDHVPPQNEEEEANYQRYLESINNDKEIESSNQTVSDTSVNLCYGCMVSLGVSEVNNLQWPQRPTREEILSEYILDDDE